jgi:hypothetical protein
MNMSLKQSDAFARLKKEFGHFATLYLNTKLPPIILTHMVLHCTKLLSYFPPKNSISDTISPRTLLTGSTLNYKKDFCLHFGPYCQVHEDAAPHNSMIASTKAAICLGPTQNLQSGHFFVALNTGRVITQYSWTRIPLSQLVLDKVNSWAANQPSLLTVCDRKGRTIGDSDQITGVYRAEQTTQDLDLTPIDSTTPPLHPLHMDEVAHLSEAQIQETQITDPLTASTQILSPNSGLENYIDLTTFQPTIEYPPLTTTEYESEPTIEYLSLPPNPVEITGVPSLEPTKDSAETAGVRRSSRAKIARTSYTPGFYRKPIPLTSNYFTLIYIYPSSPMKFLQLLLILKSL